MGAAVCAVHMLCLCMLAVVQLCTWMRSCAGTNAQQLLRQLATIVLPSLL